MLFQMLVNNYLIVSAVVVNTQNRTPCTVLFQMLVNNDLMVNDVVVNTQKSAPCPVLFQMLVNNYLMVSGVVETDAGEYTCAARDSDGCFAKVSAYLSVETVGHGRGEQRQHLATRGKHCTPSLRCGGSPLLLGQPTQAVQSRTV